MKTLSNCMVILNPISGFLVVFAIMSGFWYLMFPIFFGVYLNVSFYCKTHKEEFTKYDELVAEFSKTHDYLGISDVYMDMDEVWTNKETGKIVYL